MKIAKALKLKNRLAGEVSRLKGIFQANNSYPSENTPDYDVAFILEDLLKLINALVLVKTVIACANSSMVALSTAVTYRETPFWAVFMIAELKGIIQTVKATPTQRGQVASYSQMEKSISYEAVYKAVDIDALVSKYQAEIDELQDFLDAHNATFDCASLDDIKI
jgi:hypothetical protein